MYLLLRRLNALANLHSLIWILCLITISACGGGSSEAPSSIPSSLGLDALSIENHPFTFDPTITGTYELNAESHVENISITAKTDEGNSIYLEQLPSFSSELIELESGISTLLNIAEGYNLLRITVIENSSQLSIVYTLRIYRISSSATLRNFEFYSIANNGLSGALPLTPLFQTNIFNYAIELPYENCSIASNLLAFSQNSVVKINETEVNESELQFHALLVGENYIDTYVSSEDESNTERYSIRIIRETPNEGEIESNANLKNLSISGADINFACGINQYSVNLNMDTASLKINIEPEIDGAKIYIDDKLIDHREPFSFELSDDLSTLNIQVYSSNGNNTKQYQLTFLRSSRNLVNVYDTNELHSALRNAQANDDIVLHEGTYDASAFSEQPEISPFFYSDRSGSDNETIRVRSEDPDNPAVLELANNNEDPILSINGNNWILQDLKFSQGKNSILISDAKSIHFRNIHFTESAQDAVKIEGRSSDITVSLSQFSNIGTIANSTDTINFSAISIQSTGNLNTGNSNTDNINIRHNSFYDLGFHSAINIHSPNTHTKIWYNQFHEDKTNNSNNAALIKIKESPISIHHNQFSLTEPSANTLNTIEISGNYSTESADNSIHGNKSVGDPERIFLNNSSNSIIDLSNNTHNNAPISLNSDVLGSAQINDNTYPQYRIQVARDENRCLGTSTIEAGNEDVEIVVISECDGGRNTLWELENDNGHHVLIKNSAPGLGYLSTLYNFYESCSIVDGVFSANVFLDENNGGWAQRWLLDEFQNEIYIRSRTIFDFGLTIIGNTAAYETAISTCALVPTEQQAFRLLKVSE